MRTMRGRKRIVHVEIAELCKAARESRIVALFLGVKPHVFEQEHVPVVHVPDGPLGSLADAVVGEPDTNAEAAGKGLRHGPQRKARIRFAVGTTKVREDDGARTVLMQPTQRRQSRVDACEVADFHRAVLSNERHVEVFAHQDSLAGNVEVGKPLKRLQGASPGPSRSAQPADTSSPTRYRTRPLSARDLRSRW